MLLFRLKNKIFVCWTWPLPLEILWIRDNQIELIEALLLNWNRRHRTLPASKTKLIFLLRRMLIHRTNCIRLMLKFSSPTNLLLPWNHRSLRMESPALALVSQSASRHRTRINFRTTPAQNVSLFYPNFLHVTLLVLWFCPAFNLNGKKIDKYGSTRLLTLQSISHLYHLRLAFKFVLHMALSCMSPTAHPWSTNKFIFQISTLFPLVDNPAHIPNLAQTYTLGPFRKGSC